MASQKELLGCVGKRKTFSWVDNRHYSDGKLYKKKMVATGVLYAYRSETCHLVHDHYDFLVATGKAEPNPTIKWNVIRTVVIEEAKG